MHVPCRKTFPAAHAGLAVQTVTLLQGISNSAHGVCYFSRSSRNTTACLQTDFQLAF